MNDKSLTQTISLNDETNFNFEQRSSFEIFHNARVLWETTSSPIQIRDLVIPYTDFFESNYFVTVRDVIEPQQAMLNERTLYWNKFYRDFLRYFEEYKNRFGLNNFEIISFLDLYSNHSRSESLLSTTRTIRESNITRIFNKLNQKFQIKNTIELSRFILRKTLYDDKDFDIKLDWILDTINKLFQEQNISSSSIELYKDHELNDIETIAISVSVNGIDTDTSMQLTDELVLRIAKHDQSLLEFIQVEILPNEP